MDFPRIGALAGPSKVPCCRAYSRSGAREGIGSHLRRFPGNLVTKERGRPAPELAFPGGTPRPLLGIFRHQPGHGPTAACDDHRRPGLRVVDQR